MQAKPLYDPNPAVLEHPAGIVVCPLQGVPFTELYPEVDVQDVAVCAKACVVALAASSNAREKMIFERFFIRMICLVIIWCNSGRRTLLIPLWIASDSAHGRYAT